MTTPQVQTQAQPTREQIVAQAGFQSLMGQLQQANAIIANQAMRIAELELQLQDTIAQATAQPEATKKGNENGTQSE